MQFRALTEQLRVLLRESDVAICVKDSQKRILLQNASCSRICGDRGGQVCEHGCMDLHDNDDSRQWAGWGSRVYNNSWIRDGFYDVTILSSKKQIITFLQPLKEQYREALTFCRQNGFTKREIEIIALIIRGISNREICQYLAISKATLKTHLNHIYAKFHELGETPQFISAMRKYRR